MNSVRKAPAKISPATVAVVSAPLVSASRLDWRASTTLSPALQSVLRKGKSLTLHVEGETQSFPLAGGQKGFAVLAQRCGG